MVCHMYIPHHAKVPLWLETGPDGFRWFSTGSALGRHTVFTFRVHTLYVHIEWHRHKYTVRILNTEHISIRSSDAQAGMPFMVDLGRRMPT